MGNRGENFPHTLVYPAGTAAGPAGLLRRFFPDHVSCGRNARGRSRRHRHFGGAVAPDRRLDGPVPPGQKDGLSAARDLADRAGHGDRAAADHLVRIRDRTEDHSRGGHVFLSDHCQSDRRLFPGGQRLSEHVPGVEGVGGADLSASEIPVRAAVFLFRAADFGDLDVGVGHSF